MVSSGGAGGGGDGDGERGAAVLVDFGLAPAAADAGLPVTLDESLTLFSFTATSSSILTTPLARRDDGLARTAEAEGAGSAAGGVSSSSMMMGERRGADGECDVDGARRLALSLVAASLGIVRPLCCGQGHRKPLGRRMEICLKRQVSGGGGGWRERRTTPPPAGASKYSPNHLAVCWRRIGAAAANVFLRFDWLGSSHLRRASSSSSHSS